MVNRILIDIFQFFFYENRIEICGSQGGRCERFGNIKLKIESICVQVVRRVTLLEKLSLALFSGK